jgi:hypothetical protein
VLHWQGYGVQLVSQHEVLKLNISLQDICRLGPKISRKNTKSDRDVTKCISNKDNASFEETVKAAELFQEPLQ